MIKYLTIDVASDFMEPIHVELSDKRCEVAVFEMARKYFCSKFGYILNNKRLFIFSPTNDCFMLRVLSYLNITSTIR